MNEQSQASALEGIRVVDMSRILAGPWCAQTLGDLGADVIKIELPERGDDTRVWGPPFVPQMEGDTSSARESAYYLCANRNKRSIAVDIATPEGVDLVRRFVEKADVFVENYKVGGLAKYGLDYASLHALNPKLVYCSVTGFGQYGPYANRAGYDYVAQAMGGLMSITGELGGQPMKVGVAITDLFTGMYATTAVLAALRHAERTGQGQHIDCALLDSQIAMLANQGLAYLVGGVVAKPLGNAHPQVVPYRTFDAADGSFVVAVGNDGQFKAFCKILGASELSVDPRFATNPDRVRNQVVLGEELQKLIGHRTIDELVESLTAFGVPAGPINSVDKVFADPHAKARNIVHNFLRSDGVEVPSVGFPPKLSETPAAYRHAPPRLNEHAAEILADWLDIREA